MARTPRQQQILAALEKSGKIAIADLAETFEVSDETIRRDLKILSAEGSVEKYHGGVRLSIPRAEPPFDHRLYDATDEKSAIATLAVSCGMVIGSGESDGSRLTSASMIGGKSVPALAKRKSTPFAFRPIRTDSAPFCGNRLSASFFVLN